MRLMFYVACMSTVLLAQNTFGQPFIELVNSTPDRFSIQVSIGSNSLSIGSFFYSGHSIGLEEITTDLQYYSIVEFGEVFNPLDPRVRDGIASDGLGEVGSDDFYLGVWLPTADFNNDQLYGWAHLQPVNGVLAMPDSAISFSRGIIVGTTQVVPEPSPVVMSIGGLAVFFFRRRFKRDRRETI